MSIPENDDLQALFTRHGLRCTRQRRALYEALAATDRHPTVDQLFRQVSDSFPGISLATVYNTLEALCGAGLAQKLPGHNNSNGAAAPARYDAVVHNHLHARDRRSGTVRDVPDDLGRKILDRMPDNVLKQIESELGFKIEHVQIELVGSAMPV